MRNDNRWTHGVRQSNLTRFNAVASVVALIVGILAIVSPGIAAAGTATFSMSIIGGERQVSSGEYVQYRYTFSCSGLSTSCGATTISDTLDSNFDFIDITVASGWTGAYDSNAHKVTVTSSDFLDGASSEATLTVRVKFGTVGGASIPNFSTIAYSTPSAGSSGTANSSTYTVTTSNPTANWTVVKSKTNPSGDPAPGGDVTYSVGLCAVTGLANIDLASASLVDTIPVNTTIVDAGGGTVSGSTVTWDLGTLSIAALYAGTNGLGQKCTNRSLILNYPSSSFSSGSSATNSVEGFGDSGAGLGSVGTATKLINVVQPVQDVALVKSGGSENIPTGRMTYTFRWDATGSNVNVHNMVVSDTLPTSFDLVDVRAGKWSPTTIKADVSYSTDSGTSWTTIATVDGTANTNWTVASGSVPSTTTDVRWAFFDDTSGTRVYEVPPSFNETTRPRIRMDIPSGYAVPTTVQNCGVVAWSTSSTMSNCTSVQVIAPIPRLDVAKQLITSGSSSPGDEIQWELRIRNTGYLPIADPVVSDLLPSELEYLTWDTVTFDSSGATSPSSTKPNIEVLSNYNSTGRTLLRFTWKASPPAGSYALGGGTALANGIDLVSNSSWVRIRFTTRVTPGTSAGSYTNTFAGFEVGTPICSSSSTTSTDTNDLNGNGSTTDQACTISAGWTVLPSAVVSSQAWVSADAGLDHVDPNSPTIFPNPICPASGAATRYPCVARTVPGGTFTYHLILQNSGNIPLKDYVVYDVLPYRGDTGISQVLQAVSRNSAWIPDLEGAIVPADSFTAGVSTTIEYSMSSNPCRPELSSSSIETGWQSSCTNDWTTSPSDFNLVRAFRINASFSSTPWGATETLMFDVPMRAPFGAAYNSVAWNSMAHRATNATTGSRLAAAEPRMVGIMVPTHAMAVGPTFDLALRNRLTGQSSDPVIAGSSTVTYTLEVFNQGTTDATNVQVTDYVPSGLTFLASDNAGWTGSDGAATPTATIASILADTSSTVDIVLRVDAGTGGITITNTAEISAATGGTDLDSTPDQIKSDKVVDDLITDDGTIDEDDHDIDTMSVGATTYRIGNLVWHDVNSNGKADVAESGIAGVQVELWKDIDSTSGPSAGDLRVGTTATDSAGFYSFAGLTAFDYYVVLPGYGSPVGLIDGLDGYTSTTTGESTTPNDDTDNDDNGTTSVSTIGPTGLASGLVTLGAGEPTNEVIRFGSTTDADADAFTDSHSNYSVDFGFHRLRVGNLVWYDNGAGNADGSSTADSSESGIAGVTVQMYTDLDSDGRIDAIDPLFASATTDTNGVYVFDGLAATTDYLIGIPADQTGQTAGAASLDLRDVTSSYSTVTGDNGDKGTPATSYQSVSATFSVTPLAAPSGETDGTTGANAETVADTMVLAAADTNSDLTLDFGFAPDPVYALGNLVFSDINANGRADAGDPGISGVTVQLWSDDGDGVVNGTDVQIATTTTDSVGKWQFTGLAAGDYYTIVPTGQTPLANFLVSPNTVTDPDDNIDNDNDISGTSAVSGGPTGYVSGMVTLGDGVDVSNEPTNETTRYLSGVDDDPGTVLRDDRTNMSIDLGFYRMSVGNRIWYDANGDGLLGSGESGLANVTVNLRDGNSDVLVATTTTDSSGHYLFAGLTTGSTYVLEIPAANFASGAALEHLVSTTGAVAPDSDVDNDDSGVDPVSATSPVRAAAVTLTAGAEPTGESNSNDTVTPDSDANLTVDFGFTGLSIGNRVWFDSGNDGTDSGEVGISGVTVNLRLATDDSLVASTATDSNGRYLFSGLGADTYYAEIPASNWSTGGALVATRSVPTTTSTGTDGDDDGIDPASDGLLVKSANIVLDYLTAPTGESPDNGVSNIPDANENLTIDFGFHGLAIGNKVWLDTITVDGLLGSDEFGVGGVSVELHASAGDALLSTSTTDELGRYIFTGLTSGSDYVVTVPASQFVSGAPLSGYASTTANGEPAPDPDDNVDGDDNGVAPASAGGDVDSLPVTVSAAAEPTADGDGLASGADIGSIDDANTNFTIDFGFAASGAGTVGVGNRVWKDLDADGTINSANEDAAGVSGVTVYLHRDDNSDGIPDRAKPFLSTTTDSGGYYLFTGIAEGTYIVEVPTENFAASAALDGWFNTTGVVGTGDKNDDGVNPSIPGGAVLTNDIVLTVGGAPTTEPDRPTSTLQWDFGADANIDLTIDFGFTTLSIGNRIFYDENANGSFDAGTDRGTPNVTVELWSDLDVDGTYTLQTSTITVAGGYYEFGGLAEGAYKVVVPALNFAANAQLDVLESSPGAVAADTNVDGVDDGVDPAAWGEAVSTGVINLQARTEPTAETPDPWGQEVDANANLTVDFGFRRQCLIGGLAWVDANGNGIHDPGETPAAGVTATLVDDATGQVIATMTTDQYGWYLFEHLTPGSHTWRVDFDATGVPSQFPTCNLYC